MRSGHKFLPASAHDKSQSTAIVVVPQTSSQSRRCAYTRKPWRALPDLCRTLEPWTWAKKRCRFRRQRCMVSFFVGMNQLIFLRLPCMTVRILLPPCGFCVGGRKCHQPLARWADVGLIHVVFSGSSGPVCVFKF